ncbi:MAG: WD40 repeat domain-containing protein [Planctomycetota bacterium]|nr:MAG: WD40 repeat domain-containing protein [Planctomycetota bacterium]REK28524.1 MAG: WD40 repeat domain-containing protein [Planctomycetota bacterium]
MQPLHQVVAGISESQLCRFAAATLFVVCAPGVSIAQSLTLEDSDVRFSSGITAIEIGPQETECVVGTEDGTVVVYSLRDRFKGMTFSCETGVVSLAVRDDGAQIAAGTLEPAELWDVSTDEPKRVDRIKVAAGHHAHVGFVGRDELMIVPSGGGLGINTAIRRDSEGRCKLFRLLRDEYERWPFFHCVVTAGQSQLMVTGLWDDRIDVYDARNGVLVDRLGRQRNAITRSGARSVVFSDDERFLCSGHNHGLVRLWSVQDWEPVWEVDLRSNVLDVAFERRARKIVVATIGMVHVIEVESGKVVAEGKARRGGKTKYMVVAFSSASGVIANGVGDERMHLWTYQDEE